MWRGPALADFAYDPFAQAEIARLEELRLDAVEERIEAELALGRSADLVGELEAADQGQPAARASARTAHARPLPLRAARRMPSRSTAQTRETLDEELGLAPSPPLQRLQAAILRQEPALEVSIEAPAPAATGARAADEAAVRTECERR